MRNNIFLSNGTDVSNTPLGQATIDAGLDWTVSKRPLYVQSPNDSNWHTTNRFFATVRDDSDHILGVVGSDYQVIQNQELAYMAERIQGSDIRVESAGSIRNGSRVWYQLRGDPFGVGPKKDENVPMCLLTNGHDGMNPLCILPTTKRVICENTLNMAIQQGRKSKMFISLKHTGNISDRLESLIEAISDFKNRTEIFQSKADTLARAEVTTEFVQKFWTQVYMDTFGGIHDNPTNETEHEDNKAATSTMLKWSETFDNEIKLSGANLWTATNAVTYWLDHQQIYRGNNKSENRFIDVLFGDRAKQKMSVMNQALSLV
jgi:phage/plasmid-like protein (TIGR03299 family)